MSSIKVGDVVVCKASDTLTHARGGLFYVDSLNYGGGNDIRLVLVTSRPEVAWSLGLPADQLIVVGHVGDVEPYRHSFFTPEDIPMFEDAKREALRRDVPLIEEWIC